MSVPQRVRAAVLHEMGGRLSVEDVLLEGPRAGEVLVRVAAAGVCHSDLRLAEGSLGQERVPIVLGHEGSGVVEVVGEGVISPAVGDHVAFSFVPACGVCGPCRRGQRTLCELAGRAAAQGTLPEGSSRLRFQDGRPLKQFLCVACFAQRCVVAAASAVAIPREIPLWEAALIGCGVVTGFGAVRNVARLMPGETVCVLGCGGVGLQVIAACALAGASRVIAVDRGPERLAPARARGATHGVDALTEEVVRRVREISEGGVDHAIEVVGLAETMRQAFDVLRPGGSAVVVGLAPRGLEVALPAIDFLSAKSIRGCYYGSGDPAVDIPHLAGLVADGSLGMADVVSHFTGLEGIEEAFERLRKGVGRRTVVVLDPELAQAPGR